MFELNRVIKTIGLLYSKYTNENDLTIFYTAGHCGDLAYMLSLYLDKVKIKYDIVWIMDHLSDRTPCYCTHEGIVIENKWFDYKYIGLELTEENKTKLLKEYFGVCFYYPDIKKEEIKCPRFKKFNKYNSFEEIVNLLV